jgi:riboflavin biosynthesis pyrimidine reductase
MARVNAMADPDMPPGQREDGAFTLGRLALPGEPVPVEAVIEGLGLPRGADRSRPYGLLNMVSSVDGRASLGGRSGPLSGPADRAMFHGLRGVVDAVLVGAGTARAERYGRLVPEAARRRLRAARGLAEEPLACIVSASLALGRDVPLLAERDARVLILTSSHASLPAPAAQVDYVRAPSDGRLDLAAALAQLRERFGVRTLLCEGGPRLGAQLLAAGLLDELFLSLSPRLAGGDPLSGEALRILAGRELQPPVALQLMGVLQSDSQLFLRYGVGASASARASRETMLSSSLAR